MPYGPTPRMGGALAVTMRRVMPSSTLLEWAMTSRILMKSWPTPTTPVTYPLASLRVVTFNNM